MNSSLIIGEKFTGGNWLAFLRHQSSRESRSYPLSRPRKFDGLAAILRAPCHSEKPFALASLIALLLLLLSFENVPINFAWHVVKKYVKSRAQVAKYEEHF
jgi:hypothetical protein